MSKRHTKYIAAATTGILLGAGVSDRISSEPAPMYAEQTVTINLARPALPASVERNVAASTELYTAKWYAKYYDTTGHYLGSISRPAETGSGTIVDYHGMKVGVTAAHVEAPVVGRCAEQKIHYPPTNTTKAAIGGVASVTTVAKMPETPGAYDYRTYNGGRDAAVVIPNDAALLKGRTALKAQDTITLKRGDTVLSFGYGPRTDVDPDPISKKKNENRPVIIPGFVLDVNEQTHQTKFLTGIDGYGPVADTDLRKGDSGGALVDSAGAYVGVNIAAGAGTVLLSGKDIETTYDVDLPEKFEDHFFGIGVAQMVNNEALDDMVKNARLCPEPQHQTVPIGTDLHDIAATMNRASGT